MLTTSKRITLGKVEKHALCSFKLSHYSFSFEFSNELWEISRNRWDWEQRYIHENYSQSLQENATLKTPCPDVFWFPIVTERFADELVAEMENLGTWSDGTNNVRTLHLAKNEVHKSENDIHFKLLSSLVIKFGYR